jgi:BirA family biotin operon repressor/biotin-[acetyl-CoA-carboxylase] ligase
VIPFDLDRLERETFVRRVEFFAETSSTNDVALVLAEQDDGPFPLLVLAGRQTAGRGRGANRWWSSEGALTFSLAVDAARLPAGRRSLVSLVAGLAICETVAELAPRHDVGVKWPNDVHLDGKKVAGILAESARRGERLIVGVGINVNNTLREAPSEIAQRAAALVDAAGAMHSLTDVLIRALQHFSQKWDALLENDAGVIERLRRRCVLTGRCVTIETAGSTWSGLCRGIDDDGALMLQTTDGPRRCFAGVVAAIE